MIFHHLLESTEEAALLSIVPSNCPEARPFLPKTRIVLASIAVAYSITDRNTGGRLLVAPDVGGWNETLLEAMQQSDAVLFDGTFWSANELSSVKANARTASEMGHLTIKDDSLSRLSKLPARHKIYIHINNTNPVL